MRRAALVLLAATGALWATASAAKDGEAPTIALRLSERSIPYGREVVARGRASPAGQGLAVVVEQQQGSSWVRVATARTRESGAFSVKFAPERGGAVRARLVESGAVSPDVRLRVRPLVRVSVAEGRAFLGAKARIRIRPATYEGRVVARVFRNGKRLGAARGRSDGGSLRLRVPTPGVGRFGVQLVLAATREFDRVRASGSVTASATPLSYGATGPEVRVLLRRLKELRYHVPADTDGFGAEAFDAVLAFQKAEGLVRDGAVSEAVWAELGRARPPKPRFRKPRLHIEVDKTRQILMVVRDGKTQSVVSASTGATGNTPEGAFRIRWKAPATTTWLGPAILYRTLTFLGNEYAIHGYPSVPAYPASHGCVRVPMWVADWLYQRSPVGERVYVYD
jgi:hypothetical protein